MIKKLLRFTAVAVMGSLLSVCLFTGCAWGNYSYRNAKAYTAGNGSVSAAGITEISIDWIAGDVTVRVEDTDTITFTEETAETDTDHLLHYAEINGELLIKFQKSGVKTKDISKNLTVVLPQDRIFREFDVTSVSGAITLVNVAANKIDAESVSGDVTLTGCSARNLNLDTTSGDVSVLNWKDGEIDLETVSGDISVVFATDDFRLRFETVSGKIKNLCGAAQSGNVITMGNGLLSAEAETVSGNLTVDVSKPQTEE